MHSDLNRLKQKKTVTFGFLADDAGSSILRFFGGKDLVLSSSATAKKTVRKWDKMSGVLVGFFFLPVLSTGEVGKKKKKCVPPPPPQKSARFVTSISK